MLINEINEIVLPYIDEPIVEFKIERSFFLKNNGYKTFDKTIKDNVENKFGVYVWFDAILNEIVYIGMAGKIKENGKIGNHSIQDRLVAPRELDKITKKYIRTNVYVCNFMIKNNIETLNFYIMYTKSGVPPAYVESLLLYNFYKRTNKLPKLNKSF